MVAGFEDSRESFRTPPDLQSCLQAMNGKVLALDRSTSFPEPLPSVHANLYRPEAHQRLV